MKVEVIANSGDDLLVVNAARASFNKHKEKFDESDKKLLKYLAEHKHYLPYRHPQITFRCSAPLFVARQLGKHQVGFSWSEESRRYLDYEPEFYTPEVWRGRPEGSIKQGSKGFVEDQESCEYEYYRAISSAVDAYNALLANGVAPEQARIVLPQSMYITWVWTGSLLGFWQMVGQRTTPDAQQETAVFAAMISKHCSELYPEAWQSLMEAHDG